MSFFDVVLVQPIFNLLMLIYSVLPDFGVAIIIFTILIRFLMWPMVKKQLHQAKAMRKMQPELAKIRKQFKNNRQMQGLAMMELYKKYNISPLGSIGVLMVQLPVIITMYWVVQIFVSHRGDLGKYAYDFIEKIPAVGNLVQHPDQFNQNFLGILDLTRHAISPQGTVIGLLVLVIAACYLQYLTSKQVSPNSDSKKRMRDILAEASEGKEADQAEINAVVMRKMMKFMPVMMFFIMINLPGALSMYLATSSAVAYAQNAIMLKKDETELEEIAAKSEKTTVKSSHAKAQLRAKKASEGRVTRIKAKD